MYYKSIRIYCIFLGGGVAAVLFWHCSAKCKVPSAKCQLPSSKCQVPSAKLRVPSSKCQVLSAKFQVPSSKFQVTSSKCQLPMLSAKCQIIVQKKMPLFKVQIRLVRHTYIRAYIIVVLFITTKHVNMIMGYKCK